MQVQINTDNTLPGREAMLGEIESAVRDRLSRFEDRLTRVEVHLTDEDGSGNDVNDKRCLIEARPAGQDPVSVSDQAGSIDQATSGALGKLTTVLDRTFGRQTNRKGH
ncbi:HPF/RaiA family ribosome-associated protein [Brevundimonas sp. R86498]|uniref:HPF/RaiA family ribosome-associated protein n=1 Tax=Brevundimonas sp. R86498 TaxID=3093845 RepID=UPI0037C94836